MVYNEQCKVLILPFNNKTEHVLFYLMCIYICMSNFVDDLNFTIRAHSQCEQSIFCYWVIFFLESYTRQPDADQSREKFVIRNVTN